MPGAAPYLNNPAPGWKHDLPGPNAPPKMRLVNLGAENPINLIDAHCLEIPSPSMATRGILIWPGLLCLIFVGIELWIFRGLFTGGRGVPSGATLFLLLAGAGTAYVAIVFIRLELSLPRDEPIRFNRSRQKVYVHHFRYSWLHPLSKTKWRVEISVHDWDELWLEACTAYGSLEYGGSIQRVQISPQKNRTSDKRYSKVFNHSIQSSEAYWAMIRLYMQQGHQALPPFKNPPQPREDEEMFYNIFWDYAPKVEWPADIDLESRTAPSPGEQ